MLDAVEDLVKEGIICSSHEIFLELEEQDDIVFEWAKNHQEMFLPLESGIQLKASEILKKFPNLLDLKKQKSSADPFLIATAITHNCKVVTEEKPNGDGSVFVKIPNVCRSINIPCISLLDLLREQGIKLLFSKPQDEF